MECGCQGLRGGESGELVFNRYGVLGGEDGEVLEVDGCTMIRMYLMPQDYTL